MSDNIGTWPVARHLYASRSDAERESIEHHVDQAVSVLWALTGRQFGLFAVEARPCPAGQCHGGISLAPARSWEPVIDGGVIRNVSVDRVMCQRDSALTLPGPVHEVVEYVVDGEVRPLSELHVDGNRVWVRSGGWPAQLLSRASSERGTFAVRYIKGTPAPSGADVMVATLAQEFYAATTGDKCRLPRRTRQVQRQGVTVEMVDAADIYERGATGLTEVDLWIRAVNPFRHAQQATVWSPDLSTW